MDAQRVNKCHLGANVKGDVLQCVFTGGILHAMTIKAEGQERTGAEKSSDSMMGGICARCIKKHRSEGMKELEGGQLFR